MRSLIGLALLTCLTACSTAPQQPDVPVVHTVTTTVKVPVPVYCIDAMPTKPAFLTDAQIKQGSEGQVLEKLRVDRISRSNYIATLEADLTGCLSPAVSSGTPAPAH